MPGVRRSSWLVEERRRLPSRAVGRCQIHRGQKPLVFAGASVLFSLYLFGSAVEQSSGGKSRRKGSGSVRCDKDTSRMIVKTDRELVERFKQLMLGCGVPVYKTFVFGSRARGDPDPDSELDVLVARGEAGPGPAKDHQPLRLGSGV